MPDKKKLREVRVLVGRARHQASALSAALRELGADVVEIPFIEIRPPKSYKPLDAALHRLDEYDWLILTSVNGVTAFWQRLEKLQIPENSLRHLKIAAIGPSTKKEILQRGARVHVVPSEYIAEAVVKALHAKVRGKRVLLVRAKIARDVIPRELKKLASKVDVVTAYETVVPPHSRERLRLLMDDKKLKPDVITFTSSSTVKNFVRLLGPLRKWKPQLQQTYLASIGPITSATLREVGLRADVEAGQYTIPGLARAIADKSLIPRIFEKKFSGKSRRK